MLRILHTSDWHLGQHFIGKSRDACHRAFFQWLKHTIHTQHIDVLLVAGDIFDTATPPSYARELYHQLLADLYQAKVQVIVLGGNHDSVAVLNESASLLKVLNTCVVPSLAADLSTHLLPLYDNAGLPAAVLVALPFVRARDLSAHQGLLSVAGQTEQQKNRDLQQQLGQLYATLYQLAQAQAAELAASYQQQTGQTRQIPVLGSGHLTTVGASRSESVREIYIGSLEAFRADGFPPFAYLALGHIHQAQQVGGNAFFRYCGAPLTLGFDEAGQTKQVLQIDITDSGEVQLPHALTVPDVQPLASLTVNLATVRASVQQELSRRGFTDEPPRTPATTLWLELILTGEDALLTDVQLQLQQELQDLPVEVLKLRRSKTSSSVVATNQLSLQELTPQDVFAERLRHEALSDDTASRLTQLHNEVLAHVQLAATTAESSAEHTESAS